MEYLVPSGYGEAEFTEKRSRFIGQVWPVGTEEEARALIAKAKAKYYDARHNCWCYSLRDGNIAGAGVVRFADDGEPQGTAGQPMLEVFRRGGIDNFLCVVTRYFGGILLGAGGLTRAYAHSAKLALDAAGIAEMKCMTVMAVACPYSLLERVKNELESFGGVSDSVLYGAEVQINALLPEENTAAFDARLTDLSSGTVKGAVTGQKYIAAPT